MAPFEPAAPRMASTSPFGMGVPRGRAPTMLTTPSLRTILEIASLDSTERVKTYPEKRGD